ncbi:cubilin-like [Aricia agestis]|uniref:cubilin-like n=1 Tax=Aricia agestis TaxID=91739 RepID=UPI001C208A0E|nr:cubilin-like [Aricia agestis]
MAFIARLFLVYMCLVQFQCDVYQDRPKIKTVDGDIIIEPAYGKNVRIRPNGPQSNVYVGDVNLLSINRTSDYNRVSLTTQNADVPGDLLHRIDQLETAASSLASSIQQNITALSQRIRTLNIRVRTLQNRLNSRGADECQSHPCENGGTCLNLVNGYHCLCPSAWKGRNCDEDVNECRIYAGTDLGCQNGATCVNRPGSYECLCKPGWYGLDCTRKAKDCSGGNYEMCGHGTCIPVTTGDGIVCICDQGWTTNGTHVACLTDVDECETGRGARCSVNPRVECINLPGSFRCGTCPAGYEGDGFTCYDVDECLTVPNGGCSTSPMVSCHNTIGSRICGPCPPGYTGDGVSCTWRGSCAVNHGGCHPSAQCVESSALGSQVARCICPIGMEGDGFGLHGCYISVADQNSTDPCDGNPCGSHGSCHPLRRGYSCICYRGYGGVHCERYDDFCSSNPCQNGGTCRPDENSSRGFRCECTSLFSGNVCQSRSQPCGGVLNSEEGSITYPLSNHSYINNARCAWVIHTAPNKVINVTFTKFNLEFHTQCHYDFVQIHDGRSSASQLIGRFCGTDLPNGGNIISSHNNLYFWFRSDSTVAKTGFSLHWTSVPPQCGGEFNATTHGRISSPGSPGPYPPNRDCYYHIKTTLGRRIQLHFYQLDIEIHQNCSFDYVAVYDGAQTIDPLVGKYCNSTQPAPLESSGSELLVYFHSDESGVGKGFQISYAPIDGFPGCGGMFTGDKGEIASPGFDGSYLHNLLCEYKIKTRPDTKISVKFTSFDIENSFRCRYDYLKIYDGDSESSPLVGKYCGKVTPVSFVSRSNSLYIIFKSDHTMAAGGFKIQYQSLCQRTFLGDSGVIISPGYPLAYPKQTVCEYIVATTPGRAIKLTFQDFDIEDNRYYNCQYDHVEVRDGPSANSTLMGRYCGGSEFTPPTQISSYNYMYLRFSSDMSIVGRGFYANYTTVDIECGGVYKAPSATITHPANDHGRYNNDQTCLWTIIAPVGTQIQLTWQRFDLEEMSECSSDYVELLEIVEGSTGNSSLAKYCGSTLPPAVTISSNILMIKFVSDSSIRSDGFSVSYKFLDERNHCGGNYIKNHGFIYSPGWPSSYEPNKDCTWVISVPAGQQISLNISQFDLERPIRGNCDLGDHLTIRDGRYKDSPLIGKFCGSFQSRTIVSTTHNVFLKFHSDFYLNGNGFKIEWDGTVRGCGGSLTGYSGSIASPNYPEKYSENAECFYKISTSSGSKIQLNFTDLELEEVSGCSDDYVEIFDGQNTNAKSFGKYCNLSSKKPRNIETSSNFAMVKFRSDFLIAGKGFLLKYTTNCHNNISGSYGVIESPGYPEKYPPNSNCLWTITVPKGNVINVTFTDFNIYTMYRRRYYTPRSQRFPFSSQPFYTYDLVRPVQSYSPAKCDFDYIQIKETSDKNFTEKMCGATLPKAFTSKTNSLQIKFVSIDYFSSKGFRLEWIKHGCGGHIQQSAGPLSFDSVKNTRGDIECEWLLETPVGTSVSLTITDLYVADSQNCTLDALEIYNGQSTSYPLLYKICHKGGYTFQSTSNFMLVRLVKRSTLRDTYLKSSFDSYRVGCGGIIRSPSGSIHSKNYPNNYENQLDCVWYISVAPNHKIEINFKDLDLYYVEDEDEQCDDNLKIYDGSRILNSNYNYLGSKYLQSNYSYLICPKSNRSSIVTRYSSASIQFSTNSYGTAKGFMIDFTTVCGAVINATYDGIINSNNYVNSKNQNCTWTISAPNLNDKIRLTIQYLNIPKDDDVATTRSCPSTFLKVYDGDDEKAPFIGEYCGKKSPPMVVSRGNTLTVTLGTYVDKVNGQFAAHYTPLSTACGGKLSSEEGTIASPNYPLSYPVNIDCEWILYTSPGNKAYITFEKFDLDESEKCNEDYLEVREDNGAGNLLGLYCGHGIPLNQTVSSKLYIKFHSNSDKTGQGFLLQYGFLHGNDIFDKHEGEIASPLYPNLYYNEGVYSWRVTSKGNKNIVINIDSVEIPSYSEVCNNKLIIYDGYDEDALVLKEMCGFYKNNAVRIRSSSSVIFIKLILDKTNAGSLFHLRWTETDRNIDSTTASKINCGLNETQLVSGTRDVVITSPNYPNEYGSDSNCEWIFKSEPGRHLTLKFTDFALEETPSCFADYINVYTAHDEMKWTPLKENMCLSSNATEIIEASTYIKLNFISDSSLNKKGFTATVTSVCGGLLDDTSGVIENSYYYQRNRPIQYQTTCDWIIKVRPGRTVKLTFEHFNISNGDVCNNYVVIKNGASNESPLLGDGKYCGYSHENRSGILSTTNYLFVRYVKVMRFQNTNFRLRYEEMNIECGGTSLLENDHKWEIITSPNYPKISTPYTECVWKFTGPPGEILRIDFIERFDVDCAAEAVEIRDGSTDVSPLKGTFCKRPSTIKSSSNRLFVKYSTHQLVPRNGFKANISIDVCGATIMSDSGEVVSPNYPSMIVLPAGTICEWYITSLPGHIINIEFKDIDLPESEILCETKITVEDLSVADSKARKLKEFCESDLENYSEAFESISNKVIVKLHIGKPGPYSHISDSRGFKFTFKSSRPVCGGTLTTSDGIITTPGYPGSTNLKYCQWIIVLPNENRRVRLEIEDSSSNVQFSAYNDITYGSKIEEVVVGNSSLTSYNKSKVFESTGNKLAFYIWITPTSNKVSRFKARFSSDNPALCGGGLEGLQGQLASPSLNIPYNCEWHFTGPVRNGTEEYKSVFIKVEGTTVCRNYAFGVTLLSQDGYIRHNRKVCVNNTQVSYRLASPYFKIKATQYKIPMLFTLNWKLQPCGGVIKIESNDPINVINLPEKLDDQVECGWLLVSEGRTRMELTLEGTFNLACSDEFLLISDGVNSLNFGDYCKDRIQSQPLLLSFADTYVQYHSNVQNNRNIRLLAKSISAQCGGIFTKYAQMFTSPNFPGNYKENQECTWEIRADLGYRVSLQFIDRFVVEDTVNCTKDAVIIYDWKDNAYKEIARLCGRNLPPTFNSTHNQMKVVFRSDANITLDGFKAHWKPICGGNLVATQENQILYSPGYDYGYSRSLDCHYEIAAPGKKIVLTFVTFDLEGLVNECKYDNVTVYAESDYDIINEVLCGSDLPKPIIATNNVKIDFKTDKYGQRKGFKISYSTFSCGGDVKSPTSIVLDKADNDMNCTWTIEAPPDKLIALRFDYIDVESSYECYNGYLGVFEGPLIDAEKRLALLCGRINGTSLRSKGNKVILQYFSGSNFQSKGFKVKVLFTFSQSVGCGGELYLSALDNRILKSPLLNGAMVYENYLDCHWNIQANLDYIIQVTFKSFHIAPCLNVNQTALGFSNCDCDYLTLKDGLSLNSFVIGKYCGHNIPPPLLSSGNSLSIILSTDGDITSSGFEATLTSIPSICGKSSYQISRTPQRITSPGYASGSIPRSLHCSYFLDSSVSPYSLIHIQIKYLDLEPGARDTCDQDRLVIYSHPRFRNATTGKDFIHNEDESNLMLYAHFYDSSLVFPKTFSLCGLKRSVDFYVTGSVKINLITSSEAGSSHKGVDLEVSYLGICNKNYSEAQGRIQNTYEAPLMTLENDKGEWDCHTLITVPENHTVSTYFLSANPVYWNEGVFLEIFDGNVTTAPLLRNISKEYSENYPVFSSGRYMLLHNHIVNTDAVTFDLVYVATDKGKGCGGKLTTEDGQVTSPLYPEVYRRRGTCEWELETPSGTRLHLHFSVFDLGRLCDSNYVTLVNRKGETISTFCLEPPADYTSPDNYVKIVFTTTMNNGGTGWVADFVGVA